ncbi:hypothetical protein HO133_006352 [Letharia lupina]|uniref:Uncharacterized protein n=1 Tax=Letharia lupina TaxID=560253 RepID=A0A8H6F7B8_9LECA|nr:uncharacterized protein HO133_006352 [Letharia lupina]KAF6217940.1 hypothetical protein HO133_006352 [Letharia lupina]
MGKFSKQPFFQLICLLSLARAIPSPLTLPADTLLEDSFGNSLPNSTLAAVIPNDFTSKPTLPLDEPVLNRQNTLMLTLHALSNLALDDFDGEQQSQTWRSLQHVSIDILGPSMVVESALAIRKYAVWGIYKAVHLMVASNDFRSRNYELYWQGTLVGFVGFNTGAYGALSIGNATTNGTGQGVQEGSLSVSLNTSSDATTTDLGNSRTTLSFELNGRAIGESNVYMTLFTGILKAAPYSKDERVQDLFFVNSRAFNTYLSFKEINDPGPDGPYFEYQQLIQLFTQLPSWVISHSSQWTEAYMLVSVDGRPVGAGVLNWQIRQKTDAAHGDSVVTS